MLRAKHKEERRRRILAAAGTLIRKRRSTDFTLAELATAAEVSATTIYNLIGSKGSVLYTLLNQELDGLLGAPDRGTGQSPLEQAVAIASDAADLFIADPDFFRPLQKFQLGEQAPGERAFYMDRALNYWRAALQGFVEAGKLVQGANPDALTHDDMAMALLVHSIGVLDLWVQEDISDAEFRARMVRDTALMLFAIVDKAGAEQLRAVIRLHADAVTHPFAFGHQPAGATRGT